ncbi:MAG: hypothetical protein JO080_13095 [Mucilaginibacter sp.]|nr:hypothetical protein [Mucilaginibacter sp.]
MKKAVVLVTILIFVNTTFGQSYIITYIKGNVYYNNKLLKLHDKLDGVTQITSNDKTAELALFSAQKGKFRLSFVNSKPVSANQTSKRSELYQLIVGNYLLKYTMEKTLTTRGDFDLKAFFKDVDTGWNRNSVFLLEGELLPLKSQTLTVHPDDKFFICTTKGEDTICNLISRKGSFLNFDDQTMKEFGNTNDQNPKPVLCFIKHTYTYNNKYVEECFSEPLNITFLPRQYLQGLVGSFEQGIGSYYQDNKGKLIADIEEQLAYYYGRNFEPAVSQVLKSYLR